MLTAIGLTLLFAAMTAGLGVEKSVMVYVRLRDPRSLLSLSVQGIMTVWFFVAGMWALLGAMK